MPIPTFGGVAIFGTACRVVHIPHPLAIQEDSYGGINGVTSLFMGTRGRMFHVTGVLVDADPLLLEFDEQTLLSFADGIARTFTDTAGGSWSNVVMTGEYQRAPDGPKPTNSGWVLPFSCALRGLS